MAKQRFDGCDEKHDPAFWPWIKVFQIALVPSRRASSCRKGDSACSSVSTAMSLVELRTSNLGAIAHQQSKVTAIWALSAWRPLRSADSARPGAPLGHLRLLDTEFQRIICGSEVEEFSCGVVCAIQIDQVVRLPPIILHRPVGGPAKNLVPSFHDFPKPIQTWSSTLAGAPWPCRC